MVRSDFAAKVEDVVIVKIYWKELVTALKSLFHFPKSRVVERLQKLIDPTRISKPEATVNI